MSGSTTSIFIVFSLFTLLEGNSLYYSKEVSYWGDHYVNLGQPFTVSCKMSVFDKYKWTRDGVVLPIDDEDFVYTQSKTDTNELILTVKVKESQTDSSGKYRCNSFDRSSHTVNVITDVTEKRNITNTTVSSQVLKIGEKNRLRCPIESSESDELKWYKNELEISASRNIAINGKELIISKGQSSDAGEYICRTGQEPLIIGHLVNLHSKAKVKQFPSQMEYMEDDNVTLECVVNGYPFPKISWFVGNVKVTQRQHMKLISRKHGLQDILIIDQVKLADTNLFTCHASNSLGSDETSTFLHVKESSIETNANKYSRELYMTIGKPLILQCKTTADVNCNVTWVKDGETRIYGNDSREEIFNNNNTLVIRNTTEEDAGEYICSYISPAHKASAIISATIIVKTRKLIATGEDNHGVLILELDKPMELRCSSITGQDWEVLWYRNGVLLKESDHLQMNDTANSLIIEHPIEDDAADYMCVVKANKVDILINATVLVRTKPKIKPFPVSENVYEGDLFILHCFILSGSPKLKISWFKDGEEIPIYDTHYLILSDERHRHAKLVIEELEFDDRANYKCTAVNEFGEDQVSMLVRIKDRYAALWPFMGICIQMAILYVIINVHSRFSHPVTSHADRRRHKRSSSKSKGSRPPRSQSASKHIA